MTALAQFGAASEPGPMLVLIRDDAPCGNGSTCGLFSTPDRCDAVLVAFVGDDEDLHEREAEAASTSRTQPRERPAIVGVSPGELMLNAACWALRLISARASTCSTTRRLEG